MQAAQSCQRGRIAASLQGSINVSRHSATSAQFQVQMQQGAGFKRRSSAMMKYATVVCDMFGPATVVMCNDSFVCLKLNFTAHCRCTQTVINSLGYVSTEVNGCHTADVQQHRGTHLMLLLDPPLTCRRQLAQAMPACRQVKGFLLRIGTS